MFDQAKMQVNMDGKQYLEYLKYKDTKRFKLSEKQKSAIPFFVLAIIGSFILVLLIDELTYTKTACTWDGILMFLAIAAGIGWIIHGTGFLLVKG